MNNRQSFHIYKILEDFSKEYISFEYSPEFKVFKNYYLSHKEIKSILEENSKLISALYEKNETTINYILNKDDIKIDEFTNAQIEENIKKKNNKEAPLPIQARYVLKAYNLLRINASIEEKNNLIKHLEKNAFKDSVFPQITKMALSFETNCFFKNSKIAQQCCSTKEQYMLFYKLLAYYFRINNNDDYKEICLSISKSFLSNNELDMDLLNKVDAYINEKLL